MSTKVLIDPFPALGHFTAAAAMGKRLAKDGYEVIFIGPEEFKDFVVERGFAYCITETLMIRQLDAVRNKWGRLVLFFYCLLAKLFQTRKRSLAISIEEHDKAIMHLKPDIILADEHHYFKAPFYLKYGVFVVTFQTMTNPFRDDNLPPVSTGLIPANDKDRQDQINDAWHRHDQWNAKLANQMRWNFSQETELLMFAYLTEQNIVLNFQHDRSYGIGFEEIPGLQLMSSSFDFPRIMRSNQYSFPITSPVFDESLLENEQISGLIARISLFKEKSDGQAVIYVSLGTQVDVNKGRAFRFYLEILKVAEIQRDVLFIITLGGVFQKDAFGQIPDNVEIHEFLPQITILPFVDVLVTHGGLNSVQEAVWNELPMLVYPLSLNSDQPGNAARVVYHGLGMARLLDDINAIDIAKDLEEFLFHYDQYEELVKAMKVSFQKEESDVLPELLLNITKQENVEPV